MKISRAREIILSPGTIQVLYQGSQVWIESLNEIQDTAEVTIMDINQRKNVPVSELIE